MTYNIGQPIAAINYMDFRGTYAPNIAYPNITAATDAIAALVGVGYGSRGYGQISTTLPSVITGQAITASQWNALYAAMSIINTQTGSALTLPTTVSAGQVIQAEDGSLSRPNLPNLISTLDSNRLNADISQMAITSELSSTTSTPWNTSIYHEFTLTFSTEDQARFFFNTGGNVYLAASRTGGSSSHINTDITTLLSQMGTIKMGATTTAYTGTGGTTYAVGYYSLTGAYRTLFTCYGTQYGYTGANYSIHARVENVAGNNCGNGTIIRMQAVISTGGLPSYDTVDGTLTSTINQLSADVLTITPPSYTTTVPL